MPTKIKIIHVVRDLDTGGMENGIINLVNNFDESAFEFSICCIKNEGSMRHKLKSSVKVICLSEKEGFNGLRFMVLSEVFKKERPDIVHTHGWGSDNFSACLGARIARVPAIVNSEHGTLYLDKKIRLLAQKLLVYLVDKIITVSFELKERLISKIGIPEKMIIPIVNGVDISKFKPDTNAGNLKRNELGFKIDEIIIGSVGRLVAVKDYKNMLSAMAMIALDIPQAKMVLIGGGPLRNNLEDHAKRLNIKNKVTFLGERSDIPQLLNMIDIFVLSSISEGFSNTILEAMACARPVIATDVGDNSRLVLQGHTGYFVKPKDSKTLAEKIKELINNKPKRLQMGEAGRKRVETDFKLGKMIDSYAAFYREILNKN